MDSSNKNKQGKRIIGIIAVCIIIYLGLQNIGKVTQAVGWFFGLFAPLLWGLAFALILNVPIRFFERILWPNKKKFVKLRRVLAFILSLIIILGILVGLVCLVIPELLSAFKVIGNGAIELAKTFDEYEITSDLSKRIEGMVVNINWENIISDIQEWLSSTGSTIMSSAINTVTALVGGIMNFVISFIFAIYILFSKKTLKAQTARLIRAWLPEGFAEGLIHTADVANGVFRNFVSGQTIEGLIIGLLCMIGMYILRLPYAPMIGALVGVTALIPVVGAYIGAGVGGFMMLTVSPVKALIFVIFLIVLQQLEGNLIYPKVMGSRVNLPALWILASVTVGGAVAGPVGMLLGVPVASTAYILIKELTDKRENKLKAEEILEERTSVIELDN